MNRELRELLHGWIEEETLNLDAEELYLFSDSDSGCRWASRIVAHRLVNRVWRKFNQDQAFRNLLPDDWNNCLSLKMTLDLIDEVYSLNQWQNVDGV